MTKDISNLAKIALSNQGVKLLLLLMVALFSYLITKKVLVNAAHRFSERSKNRLDDLLSQHKIFEVLAYLVPVLLIHYGSRLTPSLTPIIDKLVSVVWVIVISLLASRLLSAGLTLYESYPISKRWPLKGYVQIARLLVYSAAIIVGLCTLLDKSPWGLLSGLGALSAVLILVFRTTILSFVASFQVISQDLIRVGDWLEMPKYHVDGEVLEITLPNIVVQNWDKTLVVVPTYKLLEDSFKNWRGMQESGGRRIKRAILIDQATVEFCNEAMLERFKNIRLIKDYVEERSKEIEEYNRKEGIDAASSPVNGRRMTNLGTFRVYIEEYLKHHPKISNEMTLMVRQLQPTHQGLPLEIYAFVADTRWVYYEKVQSDIFDHILAAAPQFYLRVFQIPSGGDLIEGLKSLKTPPS
jgi:miniconductance mechanosensitive channel